MRLQFNISAEWSRIGLVRKAVAASVSVLVADGVLSQDLAMVSAELLENAVKYGSSGTVSFSLEIEGGLAVIRVANDVEGSGDSKRKLRSRLEWIESYPDPTDAFVEALRQVAESADSERTSSGLGLIRIVSEGGCALDCDDSKPGTIVMSARRAVPAAAAAQSA